MAVTLEQARLNTQDDIQKGVIDEYRKSSYILDNIAFDQAVTPGTSGATLTYGYQRVIEPATAAFRAINSEFVDQEARKARYTVNLAVFGGSYAVDRVIANTGGLIDEVQFQMAQKIKAARALFHDAFINGDSAVDENGFDGLDKAVTGSSTEYLMDSILDISNSAAVDANYRLFLDEMDLFNSLLDGTPTFYAGNSKLMNRIKAIARRAGYLTQSEDAFGRTVDKFNGVPLIDLGEKAGSNAPVVSINGDGTTTLYAGRLGLDGVHAVALAGQPLVNVWLPDFKSAGAVKRGEVEMVCAPVVKATKSIGAFRKLKVQ